MIDMPQVEALGHHDYLIRASAGEDAVEIRMHASPDILAQLPADIDEQRLIELTAAYLIARQRADDLPGTLDLDDVAAAYDQYVLDVAALLRTGGDNQ